MQAVMVEGTGYAGNATSDDCSIVVKCAFDNDEV